MNILVTCAHGTGTGPIMKTKVEQVLKEFNIPFDEINYCSIAEARSLVAEYDVIFCASSFTNVFKNNVPAHTIIIGMNNILSQEEIRQRLKESSLYN
ncbi:MAG: PTS sugar transporter subunit IIB [Cardiobacteriaceae bacterium]|nr:PTS sugar transporter subunit IIB [Cardiobacteriaceae bacterium]